MVLAMGCGTQPIPRIAVAGTTIAVLIPPAFKPGFGRVLGADPDNPPAYDPGAPEEDPQRGEMVFELVDDQDVHVKYLELNYITRVSIDEASPGSINGVTEWEAGQVIAFLKIPKDTRLTPDPSSPDAILVERRRRKVEDVDSFETVLTTIQWGGLPFPWRGWGTPYPDQGIPIVIQEQPGGSQDDWFTPQTCWGKFLGSYQSDDFSDDLPSLTPYPRFRIFVREFDEDRTSPAAWEFELSYPANKIAVQGVGLYREGPSGALVTWSPVDVGDASCENGTDTTIAIQMIDPERNAKGVEVAFELQNFASGQCPARASSDDFTVNLESFVAYNADGVEYAAPLPEKEAF